MLIRNYIVILICLIMCSISGYAGNSFSEFSKAIINDDLIKAAELLENWGDNKLDDPEYYISQFNYYVHKSMESAIELQEQSPDTDEVLVIIDSKTGKKLFFAGAIYYHREVTNKGIEFIKEGIRLFPDHFEMRFGLIWCYKELREFDEYLIALSESLKYLDQDDLQRIYWNNNEEITDPKDFVIEVMQTNFYKLMESKNFSLSDQFIHAYCNLMMQYFPNHKYGYSNMGGVYFQSQNLEKAEEYFLKAYKLDKKDELVTLNLGYLYEIMGKKTKSRKFYNIVLEITDDISTRRAIKEKLRNR